MFVNATRNDPSPEISQEVPFFPWKNSPFSHSWGSAHTAEACYFDENTQQGGRRRVERTVKKHRILFSVCKVHINALLEILRLSLALWRALVFPRRPTQTVTWSGYISRSWEAAVFSESLLQLITVTFQCGLIR